MPTGQQIAAVLIVVVLLGLSLYYGRQQVQLLRWLREQRELPPEDRRYYRRQAWLRLSSCSLMLFIASLVAGFYGFGYEAEVDALANEVQARRERGVPRVLDAEEQRLGRIFAVYCASVLLGLMAIVFLVALDVWTIRRYGRRHWRQLQEERRAAIQGHVTRLRIDRNGHV